MKEYVVIVPLVGYYETIVKAENVEEAKEKALESYTDDEIIELYGIDKVCEGNVLHHPYSTIGVIEARKERENR